MSDLAEAGRQQVCGHEHSGEAQQDQEVERHCREYRRPAVNEPSTREGRLLVESKRGAGLIGERDRRKKLGS